MSAHRDHIADPGKAARAASGIPIVPVFDGFRAFAIIGVVLLHLLGVSGLVATGDTGVIARLTWATVGHAIDVLFIVSGFVVFLPMAFHRGQTGSIRSYAIRRVARLYPAYWLMLVLILLLIATTSVTDLAFPGLRDVVINFSGLHVPLGMPIPGISTGFGANSATWTLSVEICFYIVLPLVAGFYFRHPLVGLVAAAILTVGWNAFFTHLPQINDSLNLGLSGGEILRLFSSSAVQLPSWAFSFALGMTGAWLFLNRERFRWTGSQPVMRVLKLVALLCFVIVAWRAGLRSGDGYLVFVAQNTRSTWWLALGYSGALAALMMLIALGPGRVGTVFSNGPVRKLGDISYGIFLSHVVIITFLGPALGLPTDGSFSTFLLWSLAVIPASVFYGYLSARFLEQPIRRWARKYGRRDEG
jgi:peptidoglycan/LPS O-acetylase OafA/YrhL